VGAVLERAVTPRRASGRVALAALAVGIVVLAQAAAVWLLRR
jgi:hypothetical protein